MSLLRKSTVLVVAFCMMLLIVPSVAVADEIDNREQSWNNYEAFNYTSSSTEPADLQKGFVYATDEIVQFRVNVSGGLGDNAAEVYIDTDQDEGTGINDATVAGGRFGTFYSNLTGVGADYRITIAGDQSTAIIQEYDEAAGGNSFENGQVIAMSEDSNGAVVQVNRDTLDNPGEFDLKFSYLETPVSDWENPSNYIWAPDSDISGIDADVIRVTDNEAGKTATLTTEVDFGSAPVNDAASVEFSLTDDSDTVTTDTIDDVEGNLESDTLTKQFTIDPSNFNGDGELAVELVNGENYQLDKTKSSLSVPESGTTKTFSALELATIKTNVTFGGDAVGDDASVEFLLTDEGGTETSIIEDNVDENLDANNNLTQEFTVNPNNFNGDGELTVDVVNSENYPFRKTKDIDSLSEGDNKPIAFEPKNVDYTFELETDKGTPDIASENTFNVTVKLNSGSSKNIDTVIHTIEFNPEQVDVSSDADVSVDGDYKNDDYSTGGVTVNEDNVEVPIVGGNDTVVKSSTTDTLYTVEFTFVDGLQDNIDQGESVDVAPSTGDDTVISDENDNSDLNYRSTEESVTVSNSETIIEGADVTHRTSGGNMVGAPTEFQVEVDEGDTNGGPLEKIVLNDENGEITNKSCGGDTTCSAELSYTPTENTTIDQSRPTKGLNITIVPGTGDKFVITGDQGTVDFAESDSEYGYITVYSEGSVTDGPNGDAAGEATLDDILYVVNNRGEESGGLPWGEDNLARADVNNDGVIDITDVTTVADVYEP